MAGQFGKVILFECLNSNQMKVNDYLKKLKKQSNKSKKRGWKIFFKYYDDILNITLWTFNNIEYVIKDFPLTKSKQIYKNRQLLIKEYEKASTAAPQRLGSRGYEGSNYRIVIKSDEKRKLACYYGEFLNLSGFLLSYRDNYPKVSTCELCNNGAPSGVCSVCGKWYCDACSSFCKECEKTFCLSCDEKQPFLAFSAHGWYFHRD